MSPDDTRKGVTRSAYLYALQIKTTKKPGKQQRPEYRKEYITKSTEKG